MEHQELINQTQTLLADPTVPDWAKIVGLLFSLFIIVGGIYLGRKRAAEPNATASGKSVVLEGALVDSTSIKMLSASVEALGLTIKTAEASLQKNLELMAQTIEAMRKTHSLTDDMIDINGKLIDSLDEVSEQMERQRQGRDELTHEMRELRVATSIQTSTMRSNNR